MNSVDESRVAPEIERATARDHSIRIASRKTCDLPRDRFSAVFEQRTAEEMAEVLLSKPGLLDEILGD
jgi:hypothetical protein